MTESPTQHERTWAMLAHLLALAGLLAGGVGSIVPPLVIWLAKKDESDFIADQARESFNFQITVMLALLLGGAMMLTVVLACVAWPFLVIVTLGEIVLVCIAAIRASDGERYRYPWSLPVIS